MDIVKIGVIGLIGVLLAIHFKQTKTEISLLIVFVTALIIFGFSIKSLDSVLILTQKITGLLKENGSYIKILLKVVGITYICEFCAGICKDSGYSSVANQIEVFGKLSILFSGIPILLALLETIQNI